MLSDAAILWLQSVLRERIHPRVLLNPGPDRTLVLSVEGQGGQVRFPDQHELFASPDSEIACGHWDPTTEGWTSVLGLPSLPTPAMASPPAPFVSVEGEVWSVAYDVPSLMWWMLSRKEEVNRTDRDSHDRFAATFSHAYRNDYLDRPIVDEWVDILRQVASRCWHGLELVRSEFSWCPSHDVDFPSRYAFRTPRGLAREVGLDLLRRHKPSNLFAAARVLATTRRGLHRADPANTFDWLMDLSERYSARSAFYFICGRTNPRLDAAYEPEHPAIRATLSQIHLRGHEVGLHPSYDTYLRPDLIATEAARLRRVCAEMSIEQDTWGGRMHYLRWRTPDTLYGWELAGMRYDSTLGYADRAGFRCGTCHEYQAFDPVVDRPLRLRIRPLIAMEGTVLSSQYMGLATPEAAFAALAQLKDRCRAVGGRFTLLWHNSELGEPWLRDLYRAVVEH